MAEIFVISDTHFGHANMLKFTKEDGSLIRPGFSCVEEMDEHIVSCWNSVVSPQSHVYHLGDVWLKPSKILTRLNGHKRLIVGNHDNVKTPEIYNGFQKILGWRMFPEWRCVLTHVPIIVPDRAKFDTNIHGHIHQNASPTIQHVNACVEVLDYTPVEITTLLARPRVEPKREDLLC